MSSAHIHYTCEIIFHRAEHVPIGDVNNFSCDPYILATLEVPNLHPNPPALFYRTPTVRRTLHPIYNVRWIVAGIPETGFTFTLRLRDEDPGNHDDRLGKTVVHVPSPESGQKLTEGWAFNEAEYKVEKKHGSLRAHAATYLANIVTRGAVGHRARIWLSFRVIAKTRDEHDRIFTVGPPRYTQHFSPLIGHLISGGTAANKPNKKLSTSTFVANRLQLVGPVPRSLRHRYVGYAPFIKSLFKKSGIKGKILNRALHQQYYTIYSYDKNTICGVAGEGEFDPDGSKRHGIRKEEKAAVQSGEVPQETESTSSAPPADALARQFLRMTSYGSAGRLFTYVIMLDGEWRFTETGDEFAVELLSKHSMHADVAHEIAYSGEFFVRRKGEEGGGGESEREENDNPAEYELVIDNDSGTYRPRKEFLPTLQAWLARVENLGMLRRVVVMDGFDERLKRWKEERQEVKRRAKGKGGEVGEAAPGRMAIPTRKGSSVSSISSRRLGSQQAGSVSSDDVEAALREDAKRARENEDNDEDAELEEQAAEGKR